MAAEKDSASQVGMRNQKYVNKIKAAVEEACPGVVSCADLLVLGGAAGVQVVSLDTKRSEPQGPKSS